MCHKLVYEAMDRLRFEAFLDSIDDDEREGILIIVLNMMDSFPGEAFVNNLERPEIEAICKSYEMFIQESSQKSRTFAFWSMYIRMTGNTIIKTKMHNLMMILNEYSLYRFAKTSNLQTIEYVTVLQLCILRLYSKSSLTLNEWRFNMSFSRV